MISHALRVEAARGRLHGRQVLSFEALACRLAGGFARSIDDETLREAIQRALLDTDLGELDAIKDLPGLADAAAETLRKAWRANLDLQERASAHQRIASIARLELAVLARLPAGMKRPTDLVAAATARLGHAARLFGPIRIVGVTELSPCWRPLLGALAARTPIIWEAGPRPVPDWLAAMPIAVDRGPTEAPAISIISAATALHEAIEAMRWARGLLASAVAKPHEIAIASTNPAAYDDFFLALRADANLDLHFAHGVKVVATRDGQAAAALADVLLRGLSQSRMRRLTALAKRLDGAFAALPEGWTRILPLDVPLASPEAWERFIANLSAKDWPDGEDHAAALQRIVSLLAGGVAAAAEAGEAILSGQPLSIWRKALRVGAVASLDATIDSLKQSDGLEGSVCVTWMPAAELAASPRPFVRLVGLSSGRWPRGVAEDRLLSEHIVPIAELDPLPVAAADRRDFATIQATTARQIVLSRPRRDAEGRLLGRSPLLQGCGPEQYLRRNAVPLHAFSEVDRLLARPNDFAAASQAIAGAACWSDWRSDKLTAHDGLVRPNHPAILAIIVRVQSASSLRMLLRNPLGFAWRYGLRMREPQAGVDPLTLDPPAFGNLVHTVLEHALRAIEAAGGLAKATEAQISAAVAAAADIISRNWAATEATPPAVVWRRTVAMAEELSRRTLNYDDRAIPNARSYCETPFGGAKPKSDAPAPWDPAAPVDIPGTGFRIAGYIDRLDLAADRLHALVCDYKTGKTPKDDIVLNGGKELQRCLYAFAVKALIGGSVKVDASLLYLKDLVDLRLPAPDETMRQLAEYLRLGRASLASGTAIAGEDAGDAYDDLAFALPANSGAVYLPCKRVATLERLGELAQVWEAE
ncbi:MAG: PD-(D/E)XK nuclease family protein [Roseiarcus sp.]